MSSLQYKGNHEFHGGSPQGRLSSEGDRQYFFIIMTSGSGTISFGSAEAGQTLGLIPLKEGNNYSPGFDLNTKIRVTAPSGTYVVHTDLHNGTSF